MVTHIADTLVEGYAIEKPQMNTEEHRSL